MNEQEKARLRKEGCVHCLAPLRRLFEEALQEADFAMAEIWYHNYCGAAKMLVRLELISREKQRTIRENLLCRLLNAKYPEASPKTGTEKSELSKSGARACATACPRDPCLNTNERGCFDEPVKPPGRSVRPHPRFRTP